MGQWVVCFEYSYYICNTKNINYKIWIYESKQVLF